MGSALVAVAAAFDDQPQELADVTAAWVGIDRCDQRTGREGTCCYALEKASSVHAKFSGWAILCEQDSCRDSGKV